MSTTKRHLVPGDIKLFRAPGDPQLSPDGRWAAWVVQTPVADEDRNRTDIWIAPADGSAPARPLTASGKDRLPRWSPDGSTIAFVSDRSGTAQIWLIRLDGGEAWQLKTAQAVGSAAEWSRDGAKLAFTAKVFSKADDWQPYPGAPTGDRERAVEQATADRGKVNGEPGAKPGPGGSPKSDVTVATRLIYRFDGIGYHGDKRSQVFVVDAAGPEGGPAPCRQITRDDYDHRDLSWTPDGKLVVAATRREDADWRTGQDMWLWDVEAATGTLLYEGTGLANAPSVSPDGSFVAFLGHDGKYQGSTTPSLHVLPLAAAPRLPLQQGDAVNLTAPADRPAGCTISSDVRYAAMVTPPRWSADSRAVYCLMGQGGHTVIARAEVPAGLAAGAAPQGNLAAPVAVVEAENRVIAGFDYRGGRLVYQAETPTCPSDIFAWDGAGPEVRLSHVNDKLLDELELAEMEPFRYAGAEGWEIEGFLVRPAGHARGAAGNGPWPTVLFIHGGPHGVYGHSFMFQVQLAAANGMAVVYTNPRGSQNYGQEFAVSVRGDWGGADYQDIQAGVDRVIQMGVADPERLGITGWSYGGYMTTWTIGQTQRFRAAVAGAIVYNRLNFWGTSDIGFNFGSWHFAGVPWEQEAALLERSPSRFVHRITTPVLLLHGEADLRCPVEQAEQMYQSLRYLGRTAVLVRYPGEYHGFTKPSHKMDRFARTQAWFEHYLKQ